MHTPLQLIDIAKERLAVRHGLSLPMTDYRLAKLLGLKQQTVSGWRTRGRIGPEFTPTFASACEMSKAYVYACLEHERAEPEIKTVLETIAEKFAGKAAAVILSATVALGFACFPAENVHADDAQSVDRSIHYAKRRRKTRAKSPALVPLMA